MMEHMNLSKNHVYGIPQAISSLLPVVLSYCQTYFSILPKVFISVQSISLCLALMFISFLSYFTMFPLVSNNFATYFSLLPPLVSINCQTCFSMFPLVFTNWSTYFSIIPISFSNLFQYVKQWLSSLYPLVFSEHFHRRSLFKNALLGLIWHPFWMIFCETFFSYGASYFMCFL